MSHIPGPLDRSIISFGKNKTDQSIKISRRGKGGNIILTALCRPQVKNAFNETLYTDLIHLLHLSTDDPTVDAIVLTGTGSYFSSGADINDLRSKVTTGDSTISRQFMLEILKYPKVLCAAVNGPAIGIGVTLLLHCDLCYCTNDATFWLPFSRIALVPEFCSSLLLVERMGLSKANDLLLLGKKIDAITAKEVNICSNIIYLSSCENRDDPFGLNNIGDIMCKELDSRLFSLPHAAKTSRIFVEMVRGRERRILEKVCMDEFNKMRDRISTGEVEGAAMELRLGKSKL